MAPTTRFCNRISTVVDHKTGLDGLSKPKNSNVPDWFGRLGHLTYHLPGR